MWFVGFGFLAIFLVVWMWSNQPRYALGASVVLSLLVPSWVSVQLGRFPLDVTVAISLFGIVAYFFQAKGDLWPRGLHRLDFVFLLLLCVHILSDWLNEGYGEGAIPRACGEWGIPYLVGRLAFRSWADVRALTPVIVAVCLVLCSLAAVESLGGVNLFETAFGIRTGDEMPRTLVRWGLKRAFGPVKNPIYFGVLLLLLLPWAMYAAARAVRQEGPRWWLFVPVLLSVGIFFSGSRGPLLGLAVALYMTVVIMLPRWRFALVGLGLVSFGLLATNFEKTVSFLDWSSDRAVRRHATVIVDDENAVLTPTTNRFLLVKIYGTAMKRAGLFGFGTERTSTFPPRVPMGAQDAKTMRRIWTVDNTYVLLVLRFGYLGVSSFVLFGLLASWMFVTWGRRQGLRRGVFAAAMAGSIVSVMLVLLTVWMPHDFGFFLVWMYGIAGGLVAPQTALAGSSAATV